MSTTTNNKLEQARNLRVPLHDVLLVIQETEGVQGLVVASISRIPQEREVLLQRGTTIEITRVELLPSGTIVAYVRIVGEHAKIARK